MQYTLSATLKDKTETIYIDAKDEMEAALSGINQILERAHTNKAGLWAMGRITLKDENGNDVVPPMEEKE